MILVSTYFCPEWAREDHVFNVIMVCVAVVAVWGHLPLKPVKVRPETTVSGEGLSQVERSEGAKKSANTPPH